MLFMRVVMVLATCAYPLMVYLGAGHLSPMVLAAALVTLMILRAWVTRNRAWMLAALGGVLLAFAVKLLGDSWLPLKLYPALVSGAMLILFGASLLRPPTVIERIARLGDPHLPPEAVAYTRKVTWVWCGFFVFNGLAALATAIWGSEELWLFYNGLLSYVLMGVLFAGEWLLRRRLLARPVGDIHG